MLTGTRVGMAVLLAAAAGFVDAFGYRELGGVLVAHMSGNTAEVALFAAHGEWRSVLSHLAPLFGFIGGLAAGASVSELARRRRVRRRLSCVLTLELALLCGSGLATGASTNWGCVLLLSGAMGTQNAILRHVAGHQVRTTFVTGMLVAAVDELVLAIVRREPGRRPKAWLHAAVWLSFLLGALGGSLASALGWRALAPPLLVVGAFLAVDLVQPLSAPSSPG